MPCHVDPNLSLKILNEDVLHKETASCFKESESQLKIDHLELQITSHRIRLFHPINTVFNFEFMYEKVRNFQIVKRGIFSKMVYKVSFEYNGNNYGIKLMSRDNFERAANYISSALNDRSRWEQVRFVSSTRGTTNVLTAHLNESKSMVENQASRINASFMSFDSFLKNLEQLESVFSFVARGLKEDQQFIEQTKQSEADKMLQDLGAVDIVSKDGSSTEFYNGVATQIQTIFESIVEKSGGAMSLLDVYLYYNRMRGTNILFKRSRAYHSRRSPPSLQNPVLQPQIKTHFE